MRLPIAVPRRPQRPSRRPEFPESVSSQVLSASDSTLTTWASRSIERNGRPHVLTQLANKAGIKVIPVCAEACVDFRQVVCPCDALVYQKGRQSSSTAMARCDAKRFALFSDLARSTLDE